MPSTRQLTRLEPGLTVATATLPGMNSVSVGLWVGVGGRHEPPACNGACHFIEHLLFKGTQRRSARDISQAVEGLGGYLNAYTGEEHTCFYARVRHDHLPEVLDVLTDMFLHSRFDPADVDKERNVIKEELAMYLDQPQHHVQELLNVTLWPDQPLGRPLTGTPASLDGLGREQLLQFKDSRYVAGGMLVTAAGRVHHAQVVQAVNRFARRLPRGPRPPYAPAIEKTRGPVVRLATRKIEQTQLALGIRTTSRHDPRRFPLRLLNTLLGENMSSRLFQEVREERGLAYSIYSSQSYFDDTGALVVAAGLDTGKLDATLRVIRAELRRLVTAPPGRAEFDRARDYVLGQMDLSLESTENQMLWLGEQLLGYNRMFSPQAIRRRLATVTPRDVQAAARDFFRPERLYLALVSPLRSANRCRRHLAF